MSYAYNHRKKVKKQFKRRYGIKWRAEFEAYTKKLRAERRAPCLGTVEGLLMEAADG